MIGSGGGGSVVVDDDVKGVCGCVAVTRFQVTVTVNAPWKERYANLTDPSMVSLHNKVSGGEYVPWCT